MLPDKYERTIKRMTKIETGIKKAIKNDPIIEIIVIMDTISIMLNESTEIIRRGSTISRKLLLLLLVNENEVLRIIEGKNHLKGLI